MSLSERSVRTAGWLALLAATLFVAARWEPGPLVWAITAIVVGVALGCQWRRWWRGRFASPRVDAAFLIWLVLETVWALALFGVAFHHFSGNSRHP